MAPSDTSLKANLASELIKQAPPGGFREVVADIRSLLNDDKLLKSDVYPSFIEYSMSNFTPCKVVSKEHKSLVTPYGQCADQTFIDNRTGTKFAYDPIKGEATKTEKFTMDAAAAKYHDPLDQEILSYVKNYYKDGNSAIYINGSGNDVIIIICIECHSYSPKNFWSGLITSEYTVGVNDRSIKGKIKGRIHYYEDGNVQLISEKDVNGTVDSFTNPKELATNIVKVIAKEEHQYQGSLVEDINSMLESTFKALRRQLPITRTKIDWHKLGSYSIGHDINK